MKNKFYYLILLILVFGSFIFGLSSGHYKHFPFYSIQKIKHGVNTVSRFTWGGRNLNIEFYSKKLIDRSKKTGIYITYGQSNSANSGEYGYIVKNDVFQFILGETFVYEDPSLGATGSGGSVWGMVGDKLIEKNIYEQVVFANSAWSNKTIEDLKSGHEFEYLINNYNSLIKKFGRVDGILFHQGESDNNDMGVKNYYKNFVELIESLKQEGVFIPIYLSRASLCGNNSINKDLTNIQNQLINDFDIIKKGPDTDLLILKSERLNGYCHFSLEGYQKFSDMWVQSIFESK